MRRDENLSVRRAVRRSRLRALDACLESLESASERGQELVPENVAVRVSTLVPGVSVGIRIRDALGLVFEAQQSALRSDHLVDSRGTRDSDVTSARFGARLDVVGARLITDRIKQGLANASLLLIEAHERCAWRALGYRTWELYSRQEFGLSRSRSYELLDHGRVVRALMTAARVDGLPEVSAFASRQIKARLSEAVATIATRVASEPGEPEARKIVLDVVSAMRAELTSPGTNSRPSMPSADVAFDVSPSPPRMVLERPEMAALHFVVDALTGIVDPEALLEHVTESDLVYLERLREAADKLAMLAHVWERVRSTNAMVPRLKDICPEFQTNQASIAG
jgi:hypothetical protein